MRKDQAVENILKTLVENQVITGYVYDHFEIGEAIPLPYAVYRRVAPSVMAADDQTFYRPDSNVDLEIYSNDPDEMADVMESVEAALDTAKLFYQLTADTAYIESERFYETLYEL